MYFWANNRHSSKLPGITEWWLSKAGPRKGRPGTAANPCHSPLRETITRQRKMTRTSPSILFLPFCQLESWPSLASLRKPSPTCFPWINGGIPRRHVHCSMAETGYLLTVALVTPLSSYFKRKLKLRTIFLTAIVLCITGCLMAACTLNFPMLMTARILQGAGTGIALPLMFNIILEQSSEKQNRHADGRWRHGGGRGAGTRTDLWAVLSARSCRGVGFS